MNCGIIETMNTQLEERFYTMIITACRNQKALPVDFVVSRSIVAVNPYTFTADMMSLATAIVLNIQNKEWTLQRDFEYPLPPIHKILRNNIIEEKYLIQMGINRGNEVVCTVAGVTKPQ